MARATPRMLFALATAMTRVLDMLVAAGRPVDQTVFAALALVQAKARGEKVAKPDLLAASAMVDKRGEAARRWNDELTKRFYWAVTEAAVVVRMAATGENYLDLVLRQGSYGMVTGDEDVLRSWYEAALPGELSDAPHVKRVNPKAAAAEAKALARIAKALGKQGKLLAAKSARHDPKLAGEPTKLRALLARHRYPAHRSVLAFDRIYGGLVFPAHPVEEDWFENQSGNCVGAYACLKAGRHDRPDGGRPGLVPVVYTANDNILYIDKAGAFYAEDTIEGPTVKMRGSAATNVAATLRTFGR